MKIKILIPSIIIFAILGCSHNPNMVESGYVVLSTERQPGKGIFPTTFSNLNNPNGNSNSPWLKMRPRFSGIPDTLENLYISVNPVNWEQYVFQSYKLGKVDSSFFYRLIGSWEMDTTKLYPKEINTFFSLALGQNSKKEWVYVLDKNNNLDFSDDNLNILLRETNPLQIDADSLLLNSVLFEYETFDGHQVKTDSTWIYLFKDFFGGKSFFISEYRMTNFKYNGKNYQIQIKPPTNSLNYSKYSEVGCYKEFEEKKGKRKIKNSSKIGDYLILDDAYFKIDKITQNGDSIYLKRDLHAEKIGGTQIGMKAINFSAKSIDGELIKLNDFRGKYVLLDFWGTWCNPCIAELPTLQKINELYKDKNFVIIGVANDSKQKLSQFLEGNPLPWIQIPQYKPANDSILKQYHINSFPTTFFIEPSGKIIYQNLRGKELMIKLKQLLLPADSLKKIALQGNTKFILNDNQDADVVFARVYSEDNPEDDWTVILYQIDGKWIGSEDLIPGNYTYEFSIDGERIKDPQNKNSRYTKQGDREISILKI